MDIGPAFVSHSQPSKAVEPHERAFDDPSEDAEATAVWAPRLGHDRDDALGREARVGPRPSRPGRPG